jgi:hypothetical protein
MIHLNDEQTIQLQDSELDLVVGGFLGALIQNTKMKALHQEPNPTGQNRYIDGPVMGERWSH